MREIKFRLRIGATILGYEKPDFDGVWIYSKNNKDWSLVYIHHIEKDQFIGLKDKKGKEVYFGDFYKVSFGKVYFIPLDADYKKLFQIEEDFKHFLPEIIGNVFENPELL